MLLAMLLMFSLTDYAQTYTNDDKSLTGVFEVPSKTKAEIFSAINKWISINYNSGKSVTQLLDAEAGNIVVKGINQINYNNGAKILYPNMKSIPEINVMKFNHLIEINVKENKYRVNYRILEIEYDQAVAVYMTPSLTKNGFDCINLNGTPVAVITSINDSLETTLKMGFIGKEKRETYKANTKPMYDGINSTIVADMKATMLSIQSAVNSQTKDGW